MGRRRKGARMEMTSLMDVMFLVLVFFIYSIFNMSIHRGVKVDLPDARGAEEKGERIVITISPDDSLQLNGREMGRAEIVAKVAAARDGDDPDRDAPVIISGDRASSLGVGIGLLSELKAAGVRHVSFQVSGAVDQ